MKVLHIINNLGSGGAEKLIEELLPKLNEIDKINTELLLLTEINNVFLDSVVSQNITVEIIKYNNIYDVRNVYSIVKHIKENNYDVVHAHLFPTLYWVSLASKMIIKNKPKFIYTEHSTNNKRRSNKVFKPIEKFMYKSFDAVIAISKETRKNLIEWLEPKKRNLNKFVVIENGIDIDKINKASPYIKNELIADANGNKIICMVSRFSEAKDHATLIKSIKHLPKNTHLVLVGEGKLMNENIDLTNRIGLNNRIHFLGFRRDVSRILKTADIVVLSSRWEGLSLSSIEGLASGRPFVASRVPGLKEIVKDYGLLFEEGNDKELAAVLNKLLEDEIYYDSIVKKCLIRAKEFSLDTMVENIYKLYDNLVEEKWKQ